MAKKQRPRTERRIEERAARALVKDRERLAALSPGGAEARPIDVPAASVIELRARETPCPQCAGELRVEAHRATASGLRAIEVRCQRCGVARTLWYRVAATGPN